jgi:proline iminopeptidase
MIFALIGLAGCEEELDVRQSGNLVPKTADEDSSVPSISVNNTILHAEAFGNSSDPMVVALHGGPGSDYRVQYNLKDLVNNGYYVVFYDQRGSGLSKRHAKSSYTIDTMVDDLEAVIAYYRTSANQKVFLAGQSWGSMLATAYINEYPTRISGAILVEPGGFTYAQVKEFISKEHSVKFFNEGSNDVLYSDQFLTGKENDHATLDYKLALVASHDTEPGNALGNAGPFPFWRHGAVVNRALFEIVERDGFDFTTNLSQYNTQVLVVYGGLNTAYSQQWAEKISSPYPNVQIEKIDGSGHEVYYFGWNKLYPVALNYLNALK